MVLMIHDRIAAKSVRRAIGLLVVVGLFACDAAAAESRAVEGHQDNIYMLRYSHDGQWLASAAGDDTARIWQVATWTQQATLAHDAPVYAAVFLPDDQQLVSASGDGSLCWWQVPTAKKVDCRTEHATAVYCLAVSSDGKWLVSGGGNGKGGDTTCRVWDAATRQVARELPGHTRPVYGTAWGDAGQPILTASGDKTIRLWPQSGGSFRTLEGHTSDVYRCEFSPDGRFVASASQDGTVRLWNLASGQSLEVWQANRDPVYAVAFSSDSQRLASVGDDGFLRIRTIPGGELLVNRRVSPEALYAVCFAPGDRQLVAAGADTKIHVIELDSVTPE